MGLAIHAYNFDCSKMNAHLTNSCLVYGRGSFTSKPGLPSGTRVTPSLIPKPLPDFISQLWRKIGRRPGSNTTSRTGNGGVMRVRRLRKSSRLRASESLRVKTSLRRITIRSLAVMAA